MGVYESEYENHITVDEVEASPYLDFARQLRGSGKHRVRYQPHGGGGGERSDESRRCCRVDQNAVCRPH